MTDNSQATIFQIFLSDNNAPPPGLLSEAIESVKQCFSLYKYERYDDESLRAFLQKYFDQDVLSAYDKLRPYAYKADLGRYCLLYQQGGWYADISIAMRQKVALVNENIELVYFFDLGDGIVPERSLFDVSNSLFYSRPQHPALEKAIKTVVEHCREEYYGNSIYSPTGPSVLGKAISSTSEQPKSNRVSGHLLALTPNHQRKNLSFILPDGQIFALFKKGWMHPGDVLFGKRQGTNNYADLWIQRKVYGE